MSQQNPRYRSLIHIVAQVLISISRLSWLRSISKLQTGFKDIHHAHIAFNNMTVFADFGFSLCAVNKRLQYVTPPSHLIDENNPSFFLKIKLELDPIKANTYWRTCSMHPLFYLFYCDIAKQVQPDLLMTKLPVGFSKYQISEATCNI